MAIQKFDVFLVVGVGQYNKGEVTVLGYEPSRNDPMFARRVLSKTVIELDVPEFDAVSMEIEMLEAELQKDRADSQVRQNHLLDRISKLKAITHNPEAF